MNQDVKNEFFRLRKFPEYRQANESILHNLAEAMVEQRRLDSILKRDGEVVASAARTLKGHPLVASRDRARRLVLSIQREIRVTLGKQAATEEKKASEEPKMALRFRMNFGVEDNVQAQKAILEKAARENISLAELFEKYERLRKSHLKQLPNGGWLAYGNAWEVARRRFLGL